MSNEETSTQKIRNALKKLSPTLNDHDVVMAGYVERVRHLMSEGTSFEAVVASLAPEVLSLEAQFKAAR